jgi:hypothetical protein
MRSLTSSAPWRPPRVRGCLQECSKEPLMFMGYAAGKGTDFYSWLNIPSTATVAEINKAYRKKSMVLQCVPLPFI